MAKSSSVRPEGDSPRAIKHKRTGVATILGRLCDCGQCNDAGVPRLACPAVPVGGRMGSGKRHCWASQQWHTSRQGHSSILPQSARIRLLDHRRGQSHFRRTKIGTVPRLRKRLFHMPERKHPRHQRVALRQRADPHRPPGRIHSDRHLGAVSEAAGEAVRLRLRGRHARHGDHDPRPARGRRRGGADRADAKGPPRRLHPLPNPFRQLRQHEQRRRTASIARRFGPPCAATAWSARRK